jgi:hydrogenase/urease accessory protein HupE
VIAHLMNTGFGPFYDGLLHPFVTPEDLLPVIALALAAGLRGPRHGRAVLVALPAAWLGGGFGGLMLGSQLALPAAMAVATVAVGALAAADRPMPLAPVVALAIALGFLGGSRNGFELAGAPSGVEVLLGIAVAILVLVSLLSGQAASVRALWARIAFRVAGSWIAAIGLLMLGWAVRGG